MYDPSLEIGISQNKIKISDSETVLGHRIVLTKDVKWLCLEDIYQKFYRPNFYDIGSTYFDENIIDYSFTYKTERVGNIFLLHLFICNHAEGSFSVAVSCENKLEIDKKNNIMYLDINPKEFNFKKLPERSHSYLTTYNFTDLDVEMLKGKKLYISTVFPLNKNDGISLEIINDIKANHDCGALLTDPIASDFTIESADGAKFNIHKIILAAHSEVFKAMLKDDTAESLNSYVKLVDVGEEDLRYMLEYIYTGTVKNLENANFGSLLTLADRYNLKGLWKLSQYVLTEQINMDNVLQILSIADLHDSDFLKMEAMKFIKNNPEILQSSTFEEMTNAHLVRQLCTYIASG